MGMFGLIDALTKVRAGSGESFETFALPHIREAILDELQKIAGSDTPSPNCAELCPRYPRLLTICLRQVDTYSADTNESILSLAIVLFLSEFPSTDLVGDDAVVFSFTTLRPFVHHLPRTPTIRGFGYLAALTGSLARCFDSRRTPLRLDKVGGRPVVTACPHRCSSSRAVGGWSKPRAPPRA